MQEETNKDIIFAVTTELPAAKEKGTHMPPLTWRSGTDLGSFCGLNRHHQLGLLLSSFCICSDQSVHHLQ
jgi:hypothetical protein